MNDSADTFGWFIRMQTVMQRVKQLSWSIDTTTKQYVPNNVSPPLATTNLTEMVEAYIAFGKELEAINNDWQKLYGEYQSEHVA